MNSSVKRGNKSVNRVKNRVINTPVNYSKALLSRKIPISIVNVGGDLNSTLEHAIALSIEGKCIAEGFVKPNTTNVITHSSGTVNGEVVFFEVSFECEVCYPVHGMKLSCIAKNITKAGIRAESGETPNPMVIFIARDHHNTMPYFSKVVEGDKIEIKVIGQRFELNDKYISIIAELIEPKSEISNKKQKIEIKDD